MFFNKNKYMEEKPVQKQLLSLINYVLCFQKTTNNEYTLLCYIINIL